MKRNALMRIILWSVILCGLVFFLFSMLAGVMLNRRHSATEGIEVTMVPATYPPEYPFAVEDVNVRSAPSTEAEAVGMLHSGAPVEVVRKETVNGISWTCISEPIAGWVVSQYLSDANTQDAPVSTGTVTFESGQISDLEIDWVAGSITLQTADVEQIQISETEVSSPKQQMVWKVINGKLSIDYCEESIRFPSFGMDVPSKDLTILVPENWQCDSLEIDTAAASVTVVGLTIREAELDSASEECRFENCQVDQLDIDTASGDIYFTGSLNKLDCDAASANVEAVLINVPQRIDLDTMSGDLELTLPEDAGFTLQLDSASKKFNTDFQNVTTRNGEYIFGDGSCRIHVSAMSGKVSIWKAGEAYSKQKPQQTPYGGEK